jgi:hypothetical protein
MKPVAHFAVLVGVALAGCDTAHNVMESSYRAVTAPVRYVREHTESTPQTAASDVVNPGHPVVAPTPSRPTAHRSSATARATPTPRASGNKTAKPKPSPTPAAGSVQFPVAKKVPGNPGLVYNPFNPSGGYIDVSGYASGSKVKDPDSHKIFVVP